MILDFYNHTYPKARKQHKCEYCEQTIEVGQKYSYETGKYEGDMFVRKLCCTCENILREFCNQNGYGEFDWDWITDWLHDNYCYDCEHGSRNKDDCEYHTSNCPFIKEKFEESEDSQDE